MDWTQVLTVFAIVATNLITVITLYIHSDNKMNIALKAISDEMRDFNVKYMEETRSFHGRLISLEERNRREIYPGN